MKIANVIAWILLVIGGLNWLLVGAFSWNLVAGVFGPVSIITRIIYCLVGLSALWLIISPVMHRGRISLWGSDADHQR